MSGRSTSRPAQTEYHRDFRPGPNIEIDRITLKPLDPHRKHLLAALEADLIGPYDPETGAEVIASGGIGSALHLRALAARPEIASCVVGRALRGDELRSVLEQLPAVADVIAKGLGVTRGTFGRWDWRGDAGDCCSSICKGGKCVNIGRPGALWTSGKHAPGKDNAQFMLFEKVICCAGIPVP